MHVLMPAYNAARFMAEAIASVSCQTHEDWLLTVVDDGSTDETRSIARRAAKEDSRIALIASDTNQGIPAALNLGIAHRRASYYSFIGADDKWDPTLLARQLAVLAHRGKSIAAVCDGWMIDSQGHRNGLLLSDLFARPRHDKYGRFSTILRRPHINPIGMVADLEAVCEIGFDEGLPRSFEVLSMLHLASRGQLVLNDRPLCEVRLHSGNTTLGNSKVDLEFVDFADRVEKQFGPLGREDQHVVDILKCRGHLAVGDNARAWGALLQATRTGPVAADTLRCWARYTINSFERQQVRDATDDTLGVFGA